MCATESHSFLATIYLDRRGGIMERMYPVSLECVKCGRPHTHTCELEVPILLPLKERINSLQEDEAQVIALLEEADSQLAREARIDRPRRKTIARKARYEYQLGQIRRELSEAKNE